MIFKKILIINLGGIGDLLLSTPALRALKNKYPDAEISMLVVKRVYEVAKGLEYIDNVFILSTAHKGFVNIVRSLCTLLELRRNGFDIAVNMRTMVSRRSAAIMKIIFDIIRPKVKAGRDTEGRGYFLDITIPEMTIGAKSEMEYDLDMVKKLGVDIYEKNIDLKIAEPDIKMVDELLKKSNISSDDIVVGVHPGGAKSRRWPLENYARVIDTVSDKIKCKFIITGGTDDLELFGSLSTKVDHNIVNLVGRVKIRELAALIKRCDVFIANDSGPMHIAAILKIPLVAIFGPGDIARFDPRYISDKVVVFYKRADCAPCNNAVCDYDNRCLKTIRYEEVAEAAMGFL